MWIYEQATQKPLGIVERVLDLRIVKSFQDADELQAKFEADASGLIVPGVVLWIRGRTNGYIVEQVDIEETESGAVKTVTAYGGECLLRRRQNFQNNQTFEGTCGQVIKAILDKIFKDEARRFPDFSYDIDETLGDEISYQPAIGSVFEIVQSICQYAGLGMDCAFTPRADGAAFTFSIYEGHDRTATAEGRHAIFDPRYENIAEMTFTDSITDIGTLVYVVGETDDINSPDPNVKKREIVPVDASERPSGYDRFEMVVQSSAVSSEWDEETETSKTIPDSEYRQILRDEGTAALERSSRTVTAEGDLPLDNKLMRFGEAFDVGDVVTVRNEAWGMTADARIVELEHNYRDGYETTSVTIGDRLPTIIDAIKKR